MKKHFRQPLTIARVRRISPLRAALCLLAFVVGGITPVALHAQVTITYTDGQDNSTAFDTSLPNNPTTLALDSGSAIQSGVLSGTGQVIKDGLGTLALSAANTYSGGTKIDAGTLQIGNGGTTGSITGSVLDDAVLAFNRSDFNPAYSVVISGTGSVIKQGSTSSSITLNGASTYTGGTTISAGTLVGGNSSAFGTGTITMTTGNLSVANGVNLPNAINVGGTNRSIANFGSNADGTVSGAIALNGNNLTIRSTSGIVTNSGSLTVSGGVTGFGNLSLTNGGTNEYVNLILSGASINNIGTITHTGSSLLATTISAPIGSNVTAITQNSATTPLTLSASNPYNGTTTVTTGKLFVTGSIGGTTTVAAAGTLGGTGTVGNGNISGTLAPGNGAAGTLTFTGVLSLNSTSTTAIEIGGATAGQFDLLSVDGALAYGGALSVSFLGGFSPQVGDSFQLFKDFDSQSGTFANVNFSAPGYAADFNYSTGTLQFTAVPEPSSCLLALIGLLTLVGVARRQKVESNG